MELLRVSGRRPLLRMICQPLLPAGTSRPLNDRVCSGRTGLAKTEICFSPLLPSLALMVTLLPLALAMMPPKGKSSETLRLLTVCHEPS